VIAYSPWCDFSSSIVMIFHLFSMLQFTIAVDGCRSAQKCRAKYELNLIVGVALSRG